MPPHPFASRTSYVIFCVLTPAVLLFAPARVCVQSLEEARLIFDKAVLASYKSVDHLATVWCEFAEMELRHNNYKEALGIRPHAELFALRRSRFAHTRCVGVGVL